MDTPQDLAWLLGTEVHVHYNIPKRLWSILWLRGPKRGTVIGYATTIVLEKVTFIVSAPGRARAQRTGQRSVHAHVVGTVVAINTEENLQQLTRVSYNPARDRPATFHTPDGKPVHYAERAVFARPSPEAEHGYAWI
ncbi:hypothetical protein [Nonomuraea jabiensis]|uniref:hypothetical protein n=1 Tax=Nonomuraea jabiensis TaxID=882448 RepID=UPI003D7399FF